MNLKNEIKEVKEDLKKRIHAVEVSCYACADPIRKELALIEALEKRCSVLEKALDKACEKLEYCSKERGVFNVRCDRQYWKEKVLKKVLENES